MWCSAITGYNNQELPVAFLSHTFMDTQQKWNTPKKEAFGVYFAITKWSYYLHGSDIIMHNKQKPLKKFFNGKKANNKGNWWSLGLATYNITFEWILVAQNKAGDCLSQLVKVPNDPAAASIPSIQLLHPHQMDLPLTSAAKQKSINRKHVTCLCSVTITTWYH